MYREKQDVQQELDLAAGEGGNTIAMHLSHSLSTSKTLMRLTAFSLNTVSYILVLTMFVGRSDFFFSFLCMLKMYYLGLAIVPNYSLTVRLDTQ